jgi:RNA polymerase sigma-70 factor, ECF subfamily
MVDPEAVDNNFRHDLLAVVPNLRAFAMSLIGTADRADDLVQETLMKAWAKQSSFERGTNLKAWLFTILRNEFYTQMRKKGREVSDSDGIHAAKMAGHPEQFGHLDLQDFRKALERLPSDQKEAIILVGGSGFSYEEAAEICDCAIGTIKSRVSRARARLAELMHVEHEDEFGPDAVTRQIMTGGAKTVA